MPTRKTTKAPHVPRIITHANIKPLLRALQTEPCYQPGSKTSAKVDDWHQQIVWLEFPTGEAAEDPLKTLALLGRNYRENVSLTGKEGFVAQGLEGKVRVQKRLFAALMNLRDLLPQYRGRILVEPLSPE